MKIKKLRVLFVIGVLVGAGFCVNKAFHAITEMVNAKTIEEAVRENPYKKGVSERTLKAMKLAEEELLLKKSEKLDKNVCIGNLEEEENFCQLAEEHAFRDNIVYLIYDYHIENQYGGIAFNNGVYMKVEEVLAKNMYYTKVKIRFYYLPSIENNIPEPVEDTFKNVNTMLDEIIEKSGAKEEKTVEDRITTLERYISNHYKYDTENAYRDLETYSLCSSLPYMLNTKSGNCRAFSYLSYRLFKKLGLENYVVYVRDSSVDDKNFEKLDFKVLELHACNRVKIGDEYSTVETTNFMKFLNPFTAYDSYTMTVRDLMDKPERESVQVKINE